MVILALGIAVVYAWGMSKVELAQLLRDAEALLAVSGELQSQAAKNVARLR